MAIGQEVSLDELNVKNKEELLSKFIIPDEEEKEEEQKKALSIAERMMRRAQTNTFTITFVDTKNDDEIPIEFRLLYTQERRDLLSLIKEIQDMQNDEELNIDKFNEAFDMLKELVKKVTVTEDMNQYYDSEVCQDGDIFEIAMSVMGRTVATVEQARSFREQ